MQSKRSWRLVGLSVFGLVAIVVAGALLLQQESASIDQRQGVSTDAMQDRTNAQSGETTSHSESDRPAGHENANRLINTTSPYLLQHAYNPVDWYPWGDEALARAKAENKPIFLSVSYSTCYWCHVMEREVFENPEIAALMNELFINIKVDREQRPDLDEIYMTATQLMTQHGGWPNSVFLTPDLKPFYAGTYFGPTDQAGRPGFPTLIRSLADAWQNRSAEVLAAADRAAASIRQVVSERAARDGGAPPGGAALTTAVADRAVSQIAARYDARLGGFGGAPKFPQDFYYEFLIDVHERTGEQHTLDMALHSLRMMAAGGIHDHVGGGFHRYSTDAQWRVPHFEKMLYNQAQLVRGYVRAHEATGEQAFADSARDTLAYVADLMTGPDGQFYSALDAETDAAEGAYYVWERSEIQRILSSEQLAVFDSVFALGPVPTFPGHKHPEGGVLYMRKPLTELAHERSTPYDELRAKVDEMVRALERHRDQRKLPHLDDKVIAGWNGMMIGAYALAGAALKDSAYLASAQRAAEFVLTHMRDEQGRLWRIWRKGVAEQPAFQEDYAFCVQGLLVLHDATSDPRWLDSAVELARIADQFFWDSASGPGGGAGGGGYFFAQESPDLIARIKSVSDGAIPSGNSAMLHNLVSLWQETGDTHWKRRTEEMLQTFGGALASAPGAQIHMVHALERWLRLGQATSPATAASPRITLPDVRDAVSNAPRSDGSAYVTALITTEPTRVRPGGTFQVHVDLTIAKGWHINANPASDSALVPTLADLRGSAGDSLVEVVSVAYPDGHDLKASYADGPIKVLSDRVRITITARLAESVTVGSIVPLSVFIQYQACDDARCLPPVEQISEVKAQVIE
ncbi:MAG: DUF255 domain-containing protein [Phycisphaerales bacterium]|nr:DUF255 domain-containing protein [Phycisphaerales bacterium]